MRSVWNGILRFGQVAVPVALVPAKRDGTARFRTLHRPCGNPVQETTVCPIHGEVPGEELVKGWEVAPGEFVLVEDDELDALIPDAGRELSVIAYIARSAIDTVYVDRSYYLRPADDAIGRRAYALVADALFDNDAAIVARYVARKKENLCAVVALDERLLGLQTLVPAADVLPADVIRDALVGITVSDAESELAGKLVDRYLDAFDDEAMLVSTQRERVRALIEGKLTGAEIVTAKTEADEPTAARTIDLTEALRASIKTAPAARRRKRARVSA